MKEREKFVSREVPVSVYETDITEWKKHGELAAFLKETGRTRRKDREKVYGYDM